MDEDNPISKVGREECSGFLCFGGVARLVAARGRPYQDVGSPLGSPTPEGNFLVRLRDRYRP